MHLARALALDAAVLLLDEPFAGLDAATRADLLYDAASALRDPDPRRLVIVYDRAEAWALADRVGVMLDGRLEAVGSPAAVLERPPTPRVAAFVGFTGCIAAGAALPDLPSARRRPRSHRCPLGRVVAASRSRTGSASSSSLEHGHLVAIHRQVERCNETATCRSVWNCIVRPRRWSVDVVEALVVEIAEGRFREGASMPAVRTLAAEAGCSAGTVVRAYERLESLGLVARRDRSPRAGGRRRAGAGADAARRSAPGSPEWIRRPSARSGPAGCRRRRWLPIRGRVAA